MTWLLFAVFNIYQGFCRATVKVILNLVPGNLRIDLGNEISTPWFQVIQLLCLGFKERQGGGGKPLSRVWMLQMCRFFPLN